MNLDIVERFQLSVFLVLVTVRNCIQIIGIFGLAKCFRHFISFLEIFFNWEYCLEGFYSLISLRLPSFFILSQNSMIFFNSVKIFHVIVTPAFLVYGTEILVDWLKHAFITKFNGINPVCYKYFRDSLCRDLLRNSAEFHGSFKDKQDLGNHKKLFAMISKTHVLCHSLQDFNNDRSPIIAKRIGFVSIPLACLVIRVSIQIYQSIGIVNDGESVLESVSGHEESSESWNVARAVMQLFKVSPEDNTNAYLEKPALTLLFLVGFLFLLLSKIIISFQLKNLAVYQLSSNTKKQSLVDEDFNRKPEDLPRRNDSTSNDRVNSSSPLINDKLDNIERYQMFKSMIV